jgi:hypothetical protein
MILVVLNSFQGMVPNMGPLLNSITSVWPYHSQYLELVLETLFYAELIETTCSTVVNAGHFDHGGQSSSPFSSFIFFFVV